ncbi:hypothetical protein DPMN_135477 [Dreissena polymorpha]|uniref:B box-type domain-containing protein n=1 Tax=Dreissena polymorpha TaxID=45954 RepID=A0A9D4FXR7_DREPO|nr:hypothetical protein DPMN_135477 [Dreissena polymorpha]
MTKFICEDHSLLCCSECLFLHRNCKHVSKVKDKCQLHKEKYRNVKESFEKSYAIVCDGNTMALFNDTRSKVLNEARAICNKEIQLLDAKRSTCESVAETIGEILPFYFSVLHFGTSEQAFILTKLFDEKVAHVQHEVAKQDMQPFSVWLNADFAPELSALLKKDCAIIALKMDQIA